MKTERLPAGSAILLVRPPVLAVLYAAAAGIAMRLALLVPFGAVVVRGTATAFLACGWHAVCIRQKIR